MVLGNVPKLHGLIGLLAATVAVPIGCSGEDFSGCEATRTCKPNNGGDSGSGGEAGAGTDTGGSSGSSSSGSGPGGANDGGGSGDDTERPTIVSFTPLDGEADVERDIEVTAELSEPIDEASVTDESVTLEGPDGEVPGTLSVSENVISFVPDKPLYLLGDYTFTLADTVADLAGNTLAEVASAGFQVRDGRWGAITTPFGRTARHFSSFARNASGDVVIAGAQPNQTTIWAAVYNATEDSWTSGETLTLAEQVSLDGNSHGLGIDPQRRVAMTWTHTTSGGWYRFTEDEGWDAVGALSPYPIVAVTVEGLATAIWLQGGMLSSRTLDIATGTVGSVTPLWASDPPTQSDFQAVASVDRIALFERTPDGAGHQLTVAWLDQTSGWGSREPIASADDISGIWLAESDGEGNIAVIWLQGNQVWSRIYDHESETWSRSLLIASESTGLSFGVPRVAAGNVAVPVYSGLTAYAAYYQREVGWIQDSIIDLADIGVGDFTSGFGVEMAIDNRGNMLAIGHTGYRRYVPGQGWQASVEHGLELGPFRMWASTALDGSIVAITHDLAVGDELIPAVVRFE